MFLEIPENWRFILDSDKQRDNFNKMEYSKIAKQIKTSNNLHQNLRDNCFEQPEVIY